jgi:hypothetical protein
MKRSESEGEPDQSKVSALIAGVRFELVIAVCALFISTLATAASWWQTQATWQQTRIIDEQLSAQVWPYLGFSEGIVKADTDEFTIENDGLGPAVVRSVAVLVEGRERTSFVDMLHAVLGPNIVRRKAHGESIGLSENAATPGFVLRPGDSQKMLTFRSKTFAKQLILAYRRINIRTCYCAIVPGRCWQTNTAGNSDPQPIAACREDSHDLLHVITVNELFRPF